MRDTQREYDSYRAKYCEACGQLVSASDEIGTAVEEPVHRAELIKAIAPVPNVVESTALERGSCDRCNGQLVQRFYLHPLSAVPEMEYEPREEDIKGRDPDEDALINLGTDKDDWQEVSDVSWIKEGSPDG